MIARKKLSSTSQATRMFKTISPSPSLSWSILGYLMIITNLVIRAYAQNNDELFFENTAFNANPMTRFQFVSPQSSAGQGSSSNAFFVKTKNAIEKGLCNMTLGIQDMPSEWHRVKKWDSYPQGILYVGTEDKNNTNPIACVLRLLDQQHILENKLLFSYALPLFLALFLFIIVGMISYALLANKARCQSSCIQHQAKSLSCGQIITKFRNFLRKNNNADIILLNTFNEENEKNPTYYSIAPV